MDSADPSSHRRKHIEGDEQSRHGDDMTRGARVLCLPDWRESNPYQSLLQQSLGALGLRVDFTGIPGGTFPLLRSWWRAGRPNVIHLHWSNELIGPCIWPRSQLVRDVRRHLMVLDVWILKRLGVRVVWTIHNLLAHESAGRELEFSARAALARVVDQAIVHSSGALRQIRQAYAGKDLPDHRVTVIPHGNYDGCYPANPAFKSELSARWGLGPETTTILFFGAIRPYKGLERLLAGFSQTQRRDLKLIVAGRPSDATVREMVESATRQDSRIVALLGFIADEQVSALFELADVVAIPFERALTSGSAVLAMTFGKALILPELARELEFAAEGGGLYFDEDAQLAELLESLSRSSLQGMGLMNRRLAAARNWGKVASDTRDAYRQAVAQSSLAQGTPGE